MPMGPRKPQDSWLDDFFQTAASAIWKKMLVREGGVEPPRPKALEPKSSASANSATLAQGGAVQTSMLCQRQH